MTAPSPAARTVARALAAGYADPAAPCGIPGCPRNVAGVRIITVTRGDAATDAETVLMRLCRKHAKVPHARLLRLLPALAEFTLEATQAPSPPTTGPPRPRHRG